MLCLKDQLPGIFFLLLDFCDDGFFPFDDDFVGLLLAAFLSMMPARFVRLSYRVQLIRNVPNVDIYIFWNRLEILKSFVSMNRY